MEGRGPARLGQVEFGSVRFGISRHGLVMSCCAGWGSVEWGFVLYCNCKARLYCGLVMSGSVAWAEAEHGFAWQGKVLLRYCVVW